MPNAMAGALGVKLVDGGLSSERCERVGSQIAGIFRRARRATYAEVGGSRPVTADPCGALERRSADPGQPEVALDDPEADVRRAPEAGADPVAAFVGLSERFDAAID